MKMEQVMLWLESYIYYRYKNFSLEKSLSLGVATGTVHAKSKKYKV